MHRNEKKRLAELDRQLAERHGVYLSYPTPVEPVFETAHGDGPAEEVDRLLDRCATPEACVLDLGCGVGFTACRLAAGVRSVWAFEQQPEPLEAARLRAAVAGLGNVTFVLGNVSEEADAAPLPDNAFDFGFSRRGPNLVPWFMPKLKPSAIWVQEFAQFPIGINEVLGQAPELFRPHGAGRGFDWAVDFYANLGMLAVSVKAFFYEQYFRDADHLADYLCSGWFLREREYDPGRDRAALDLYARYNRTERGVRLVGRRVVGVYHREAT